MTHSSRTILILLLSAFSACAQIKDFRNATIVTSKGDTLTGRVVYKSDFDNKSEILFKRGKTSSVFNISELSSLVFEDGERYTTVHFGGDTVMLLPTYVHGDLSVYSKDRSYYVKKDTTLYDLDDRPVTILWGDGKTTRAPSKNYLTALNQIYVGCLTADIGKFKHKVSLRPLVKLTMNYATCSGLSAHRVKKKHSAALAVVGGTLNYRFRSDFFARNPYNSGTGGIFYGLSLTKGSLALRKFKWRIDVNYVNTTVEGAYRRYHQFNPLYPSIPGDGYSEYQTYTSSIEGVRIPVGMQYHLLDNEFSLYVASGVQFNLFRLKFDAEGYLFTGEENNPLITPFFDNRFNTRRGLADIWALAGFDIPITKRLKVNAEIKGSRSSYRLGALTITDVVYDFAAKNTEAQLITWELLGSLGLKYKL